MFPCPNEFVTQNSLKKRNNCEKNYVRNQINCIIKTLEIYYIYCCKMNLNKEKQKMWKK